MSEKRSLSTFGNTSPRAEPFESYVQRTHDSLAVRCLCIPLLEGEDYQHMSSYFLRWEGEADQARLTVYLTTNPAQQELEEPEPANFHQAIADRDRWREEALRLRSPAQQERGEDRRRMHSHITVSVKTAGLCRRTTGERRGA